MKVLIIKPNEEPYLDNVWNDLDTLREIVGVDDDRMEVEEIHDKKALVVYDRTTLKNNIPINRYIDELAIRGTFVITGNDKKEKDFTSLTEEQIEKYTKLFTLEREEELEL